MKFTPGPGLGGHCIPIDPLYLSWKMKELNYTAKFIELASEINTNMPRYVVSRLLEALNDRDRLLRGSNILVLGVAYKPEIDDMRESPAIDVIGLLEKKGAHVQYYDPYIESFRTHDGQRMQGIKTEAEMLKAAEKANAVVIITNHKKFDYPALVQKAGFIFDTRNALGKLGKDNPKVMRL
jgi:UDP-N-acetyl-D-glucosamine dehydrogenase